MSATAAASVKDGRLYIAGEWRSAKETFANRNPARPDEVIGHFAQATPDDVDDAYVAATVATEGWRETPAPNRGEMLYRAAELLDVRAEEIAHDLSWEEGKTLAEAFGEVRRGVAVLRYFAGAASQPLGSVYPSVRQGTFLYTAREPLGVILVITPWNFPIAIPLWKIAPALGYGNTVVWKPSELTPLCAVRIAELLHDAGAPPGVFNLVSGHPDRIGSVLTGDYRVDGVSFTGSLHVGRMIESTVAPRGVKVQLELGGKNPVIILPDADMRLAVEETVKGAMMSTGQKCTATSRAICVGDAAERFVPLLLKRVAQLKVGNPHDPTTDIGPLVSDPQLDRVTSYFDVAEQEQHALAVGATRLEIEGGYYVSPTVYLDVSPDSRLGQEEVFGPLLAVMRAQTISEAVEIANNVRYGLSASLFTRDIGAAFSFARTVRAGVIHINSETAGAEPQVPFGGMKDSSSHSREQGDAAVQFYTDVKTVYIDPPTIGEA